MKGKMGSKEDQPVSMNHPSSFPSRETGKNAFAKKGLQQDYGRGIIESACGSWSGSPPHNGQ